VRDERYRYSLHGDRERLNDSLSLNDIEQALLSGRIQGAVKAALLQDFPIRVNPFMWFVVGWATGW